MSDVTLPRCFEPQWKRDATQVVRVPAHVLKRGAFPALLGEPVGLQPRHLPKWQVPASKHKPYQPPKARGPLGVRSFRWTQYEELLLRQQMNYNDVVRLRH